MWFERINQWRLNRLIAGVLPRLSVSPGAMPFTLLSMVHSRDVLAYTAAVVSFTRQANPQRIVVVCDPSITAVDRTTLRRVVPHVELWRAENFQHEDLPTGGTWERLQAMVQICREQYTIQLDADTLTLQPIPEVLQAISSHSAFTLSDRLLHPRMTHDQARAVAAPWQSPTVHIQGLCEYLLPQADLPQPWYARGCSGFFALPPDPLAEERMLDFSSRMQAQVGARWQEWGTEQVTANYVAANCERFMHLPWPRYGEPPGALQDVALAHFIGRIRHSSNRYIRAMEQFAHAVEE